jgi:cytochrome P450
LSEVVHARQAERLTDEEIAANAQIIFFGGISTVEALILDALWALALDPAATASVRREPERLGAAIEETVRWAGPVQSATRHAARDIDLHGVAIGSGEIVNCILAAANRDPVMFAEPDRFDISRPNAADQVGFGAGPHFCLGAHLAKVEATIALGRLFSRLPDFRVDLARSEAPSGYEFRQPRRLMATWER